MNKNKFTNKRKQKIVTVICDGCKYEFLLNNIQLKEEKIILNNTPVNLVYFTCPNCEKIHRVSIQDARYYDLKEDLEKTKKRIRKNQGSKNIELAETLNNMVIKKHERLKAHVDKVNKMFPGTFTFEVSENNPKEKVIKYLP